MNAKPIECGNTQIKKNDILYDCGAFNWTHTKL